MASSGAFGGCGFDRAVGKCSATLVGRRMDAVSGPQLGRLRTLWSTVVGSTCAESNRCRFSCYWGGRHEFLVFWCRYRSGANGGGRYYDSHTPPDVPSSAANLQSIDRSRRAVGDAAIADVYRSFTTLRRQTGFGRNACNVLPGGGLPNHAINAAASVMAAAPGRVALGIRAYHQTASSPFLGVLTSDSFVDILVSSRLEILFMLADCAFRLIRRISCSFAVIGTLLTGEIRCCRTDSRIV